MNDFTKEELEEIVFWENGLDSYYCEMGYGSEYASENNPLVAKIKAMIDNYCEHEDSEADHDYEVMRCNKCQCLHLQFVSISWLNRYKLRSL